MTTTIFAGGAFTRLNAGTSDTTPDAFTFIDHFNVPTAVTRTSNTITVSGIDAPSAISISGDASSQYSINGGAYTASGGTVINGDTVTVKHTSSGSAATQVDSTLTIGGVSDTFSSTTAAAGGTASIAPVVAIFRRRRLS